MSWRPEGNTWEQTKKEICKRTGGFFNQEKPCWVESDLLCYEAGADAMLKAVSEEIEKVENPYPSHKLSEMNGGFEYCRQKILALLRKKSSK